MEEKKLKGWSDNGRLRVKCNCCDKELLVVQMVKSANLKTANVKTRILVSCGFCGGSSEVHEIEGSFFPGAPSDDILFDTHEQTDGAEYDYIFTVRKK